MAKIRKIKNCLIVLAIVFLGIIVISIYKYRDSQIRQVNVAKASQAMQEAGFAKFIQEEDELPEVLRV